MALPRCTMYQRTVAMIAEITPPPKMAMTSVSARPPAETAAAIWLAAALLMPSEPATHATASVAVRRPKAATLAAALTATRFLRFVLIPGPFLGPSEDDEGLAGRTFLRAITQTHR